MKFVWVFIIATLPHEGKKFGEVLVAVTFDTEQECREFESHYLPPPNVVVGCLPSGVP